MPRMMTTMEMMGMMVMSMRDDFDAEEEEYLNKFINKDSLVGNWVTSKWVRFNRVRICFDHIFFSRSFARKRDLREVLLGRGIMQRWLMRMTTMIRTRKVRINVQVGQVHTSLYGRSSGSLTFHHFYRKIGARTCYH